MVYGWMMHQLHFLNHSYLNLVFCGTYWIPNCSNKAVSLILITNICFHKQIVAAKWSACRRQTLRPAASWSQPAGNSVHTSCLSHTSTQSVTPACSAYLANASAACQGRFIPGVWPTWVCIYISEGKGLVVGERKVTEIPGLPLMHQDDGTG